MFGRRIDPVGQQREVQLALGRGQMVNLEPFEFFFDRLGRRQERGDGHQRPQSAVAHLRAAPSPEERLHRSRW